MDPLKIPDQPKLSLEYKDLLIKCLEKDPAKRITVVELCNHPLFDGSAFIAQDQVAETDKDHAPLCQKVERMNLPSEAAQETLLEVGAYNPPTFND